MVKLLRTDTTLDLSQKARVVKIPKTATRRLYTSDGSRTDHVCPDRRTKQRSKNGAPHFLITLSAPGGILVLFPVLPDRTRIHEAGFGLLVRDAFHETAPLDGSTWTVFRFSSSHATIHFGTGRLPPLRLTLPSIIRPSSHQESVNPM